MKTKVLFRTFRDGGDVVALFPERPADNQLGHCLSYQAIGQHGAASVDLSFCTRPSTAEEIAPLKAELERIGYNVQTVQRVTAAMHRKRASFAPAQPFTANH
jgi:hypothetical protein